MIRYTLTCPRDHRFDGWFQNAQAYEDQRARGLIGCSICGATDVSKTLMAPAVKNSDTARPLAEPSDDTERALRALRKKVEEESDYVGRDFASEARQMHEGEIPHRSIWGEARADEAKALIEDGVPVAPLPYFGPAKTN